MGLRRFVDCDVNGCEESMPEVIFGQGWSNWGEVKGRQDTETGASTFFLCPKHLNQVFDFVTTLKEGE